MMDQYITHSPLFKQQSYIKGAWQSSDTTIEVTNPATGEVIGTIPDAGSIEATNAIEAAHAAFPAWSRYPANKRSNILKKWHQLILQHQEDLAHIMTIEQGKILAESRQEIAYAASFVEWFAEEAKRIYGSIIPAPKPGQHSLVIKQPVGVVAAITPWNFPAAMITRKIAPALAAGCTVVVKPSELTPYSALALAQLADEAGFPAGVVNILTGDAATIGEVFTTHPLVQKISFTGSTRVGKLLMQQSASTVKKLSLELGGNAPFIIFEDADIDKAIEGVMASKFRNSGQTCICANRILVQDAIYEKVSKKLTERISTLKTGNGLDEENQQGPLINQAAIEKITPLIDNATKQGASILVGGSPLAGTFFEPTLLGNVTPDMEISSCEIFGPILPLTKFSSEEQAIHIANDTPFGLAAYFYAKDADRIWRVSEALEYGMVGVNENAISNATTPFGGVKESGIGREGSYLGVDEFIEHKYICWS